MNKKLLLLIYLITPLLISAEEIDRIKWEEIKIKEFKTWKGKIGGAWAVSASSQNEHGVSEVQIVSCPGTDKKITISTERDEESKKFRHIVSVPKDYPYDVQIEPSQKTGGVVLTVHLKEGAFWILFTDPNRNFVGINNSP